VAAKEAGSVKKLSFVFFAGLAWSIWKNRNKMAIEKTFPSNPDAVISATTNCLQMWADLHKELRRRQIQADPDGGLSE
jgi:hypothetical protein